MQTNRDIVAGRVENILVDPTCRLDVTYWKNFAVDFNKKSRFRIKTLVSVGQLRNDTLAQHISRDVYYPFKITYSGHVILKESVRIHAIRETRFKLAKAGDIVFSRINCCRGAIGIVEESQTDCICTGETHVFTVTDSQVDNRYLHTILRHPYYQDLMLAKSTGASLERRRFHETELLSFEVPIPPYDKQLELIRIIRALDESIRESSESVERLRIERNRLLLTELGIDLVYSRSGEESYALSPSKVTKDNAYRLDFEHNKPSFRMIKKLQEGKYRLVKIGSDGPEDKILKADIKSGSTPKGGIYPTTGIPFLQAGNIMENGIDLTDLEYVTPEFHEGLKRSQLTGNEVLVAIAGTIGRTGVNDKLDEGNINQAIALLRLNSRMLPLFLSAVLNSDAGRIQFAKLRHDFGTPNINTTELANIKVPLPPPEVQESIVSKILDFEKRISGEKKKREESQKQRSEAITEFLLGEKEYEDILERTK
jgi:restriction endonuclease S subunit